MQLTVKTPRIMAWRIEEEFANTPHLHEDQFQITIPLYGKCFFTQENRTYDLSSGECLVQYPQDRHSFYLGADSGVMILQVDRAGMDMLSARGPAEPAFRQRIDPALALEGFRSWYGALLAGERIDRLATEEIESKILFFLYRHLEGSHSSPGAQAPIWAEVASADRPLARVLSYIREHYAEPLGVDELAAIAMQSRFHFIRSFKTHTGTSPYQYVLRIRVEAAKGLLLHTRMTVTDVALQAGFASVSQFHRAFAKTAGMTPEQFRAAAGKESGR